MIGVHFIFIINWALSVVIKQFISMSFRKNKKKYNNFVEINN